MESEFEDLRTMIVKSDERDNTAIQMEVMSRRLTVVINEYGRSGDDAGSMVCFDTAKFQ